MQLTAATTRRRPPRVEPLRTVPAGECKAPSAPERVECPTCGKLTLGVANSGKPRWSQDHDRMIRTRVAYCDHCDHVMAWDQACDLDGRPHGWPLKQPDLITARRHIDWHLIAYPEIAGVEQA